MLILKADKSHIKYILDANKKVNDVSGLTVTRLEEFIEKDLFGDNPLFGCFVAVENDKVVGMCIYCDMYMADHGLGFYLSNVYVEPEFRKQGIFSKFLAEIQNTKKYHFLFAFVGKENCKMKNVIEKMGAKEIDLSSYMLKFNN